jgi:hypothetical protein
MGKKQPDKAVATVTQAQVPDFIQPGTTGFENMRAKDIQLPRAMLMQALSPGVVEGTFRSGDLVNNVTNELIIPADQELKIIPFFHFISWIEWGDRNKNEGLIDMSLDPDSELAMSAAKREKKIGTDGKESFRVTEYHNIVALLLPLREEPDFLLFGFCKTSYKAGKKLLNLARMRGSNLPLFAGKYALWTKTEERKNNKYKVFDCKNDGWVSKSEYEAAQNLYTLVSQGFKESRIAYSMEPEHDDEDNDAAAAANDKEM